MTSLCKIEWSKDELITLVDTFKQKEVQFDIYSLSAIKTRKKVGVATVVMRPRPYMYDKHVSRSKHPERHTMCDSVNATANMYVVLDCIHVRCSVL